MARSRKTVKSMTYSVNGEAWRFHVLTDRAYIRAYKGDSDALCDLEHKEVWFRVSTLNHATIAHELMHILFDQANHTSADLNPLQVEELACEIVARSFLSMPHLVNEIWRLLR